MTPSRMRFLPKQPGPALAGAPAAALALLAALMLAHPAAGDRAALAAATVYSSPSAYTTVVSATVTLDLMVDCGVNADAVSVIASFDPRLLQAQAVVADASFPNTLRNTIDNSLGRVYFDAGAPLTCHDDSNCPSGVVRAAQLRFVTVGAAAAPTSVGLAGKIVWSGSYVFNGSGAGSSLTIRLRGDVDADCDVDLTDMMLVAQAWDTVSGGPGFLPAYDLDSSGAIDVLDVMNVAIHWGDVCVVP